MIEVYYVFSNVPLIASCFIKKKTNMPENRPQWYNMVQSMKGDYAGLPTTFLST